LQERFENGQVLIKERLLSEKLDLQPLLARDDPRVRGLDPSEDAEQRGLPATVRPDNADAVAILNAHGDVGEELLDAVGFGQSLYGDDVHVW